MNNYERQRYIVIKCTKSDLQGAWRGAMNVTHMIKGRAIQDNRLLDSYKLE